MSALAGGMAAWAGELPMMDPVAEAAAAAPATCRRRRLLTEDDILNLSVRERLLVVGVSAHVSGGRVRHVTGLSADDVASELRPESATVGKAAARPGEGARVHGGCGPIGPLH